MNNNLLNFLEEWYASQCDADWEHEFGVTIETIDNPGWSITIDLVGTECEGQPFDEVDWEKSDNNWIQCKTIDNQFRGSGGPKNLQGLIQIFLDWRTSILDKV